MNVYATDERRGRRTAELFALDPGVAERQVGTHRRTGRGARRGCVPKAPSTPSVVVAREGGNVMAPLIDAVRVGATLGELSDVFREVFGEFREPSPW